MEFNTLNTKVSKLHKNDKKSSLFSFHFNLPCTLGIHYSLLFSLYFYDFKRVDNNY